MADIYEQLESCILLLDGGFGTMVPAVRTGQKRTTAANGSATGHALLRAATTCWR